MNSNNYHDYVFKNGKLIAEFEQMYKKSKDVPWHQDDQENWLDILLTIDLLKDKAPYDYILDFGSGLGYFLNILGKNVGKDNSTLIGMDISKTACLKAKKFFQNSEFRVFDLMKDPQHTKIDYFV